MWIGARLAAVGIAEGLGASMTLIYARVCAATQLARYPVHLRNVSRGGRENQLGSIPFSWRGTLSEKTKQNQNLILAEGAQGRAEITLSIQVLIVSHLVKLSH
jgi:hypothetical protein